MESDCLASKISSLLSKANIPTINLVTRKAMPTAGYAYALCKQLLRIALLYDDRNLIASDLQDDDIRAITLIRY